MPRLFVRGQIYLAGRGRESRKRTMVPGLLVMIIDAPVDKLCRPLGIVDGIDPGLFADLASAGLGREQLPAFSFVSPVVA